MISLQKRRSSLIHKACNTIKQHGMLADHDQVLAAVSGGPDSVALLLMLLELQDQLQLAIGIAHINHCLRGEESDRDEAFVRSLARQHRIACHICKIDVPAIAKSNKLSFEEAARNVRYAFYQEISQKNGYNRTALGHNCDDNAELVLMNLLRGSGTKGLTGIPPVRPIYSGNTEHTKYPKDQEYSEYSEYPEYSKYPEHSEHPEYPEHSKYSEYPEHSKYSEYSEYSDYSDYPVSSLQQTQENTIIRPLIEVSRQEIMTYLTLKQQAFVLDSSNADNIYLRNRIRNILIPHLKENYNPSVTESLNRLSRIIMDEESWMAQETERLFNKAIVDHSPVKQALVEQNAVNAVEKENSEIHLDRNAFKNIHPALAKRLARRAIEAVKGDLRRISMVHIEGILNLISATTEGRILDLPGRIRMIKASETICFRKESRPLRELGRKKVEKAKGEQIRL